MKKLLVIILMLFELSGCSTTKNIKEMGLINIGLENNINIQIQIEATVLEDKIIIQLNGKEYFNFILNVTNSRNTLEKDIKYKGNIVKAKCRFNYDSDKTTLNYTAHECLIYVNGTLEFKKNI